LLGADVALGVWARQIEAVASVSPSTKNILALIAPQLVPSAIRTRAKFLGFADR